MSALFLSALAWYAVGIAGFLSWWSADGKLDRGVFADSLVFGIMGPLTVPAGYLVRRLTPGEDGIGTEAGRW